MRLKRSFERAISHYDVIVVVILDVIVVVVKKKLKKNYVHGMACAERSVTAAQSQWRNYLSL